ncbi:MAG: Hsp20 family protein [Clostridiales bacterium]|nr:Hsp20 family protein [Clostridiales bacterium]
MYSLIPNRRNSSLLNRRNFLLEDSFFRPFMNLTENMNINTFCVDIKEKENAYVIEAELAGVSEDNIALTVDKDVLTISADIMSEETNEGSSYHYSERRTGHVERSFNLKGINQDDIQANFKDGLLRVELPKADPIPEKNIRNIKINSEPKLVQGEES